jgi:replicative DNA helicase
VARTADDVVRLPAGHRLPPQDLEAEQSVLGSMLLSADAMSDVVELLQSDDFYRSANAKIFEILRSLFAHGEPVDVITGVDALRRAGILDEIGGPLYLRDLVDQVPTPAGAAHYAKIVADAALRRRLIGAAADIMDVSYAGERAAEQIADDAEQRIYDVARREDTEDSATAPCSSSSRSRRGSPPTRDCPRASAISTTSPRACSPGTWSSSRRDPVSGSPRSRSTSRAT